jgi:hypothetical protein
MFWYAVLHLTTSSVSKTHELYRSQHLIDKDQTLSVLGNRKQMLRFYRPLSRNKLDEKDSNDNNPSGDDTLASTYQQVSNVGHVDRRHKGADETTRGDDAKKQREPPARESRMGHQKHRGPSSGHPCSNFTAVLHIASGDKGAAAGTLFFQYVINQLIYAEFYNLMPWIHLNNVSVNSFDETVHSVGYVNITVAGILEIPSVTNSSVIDRPLPGRPKAKGPLEVKTLSFRGTGVWNHYFEPVSAYDPEQPECQALPYATLDYEQLNPSIQFHAPWAVRSWEYNYMPPSIRSNVSGGLHQWYAPQRQRAHAIVKTYYRFRPNIVKTAAELIPDGMQCCGVHIRHSDKAGLARHKLPVDDFYPYIQAYRANGGSNIYLATDSSRVVDQVQRSWINMTLIVQGGIVRSDKRRPVFYQATHNRTNTEVLVDIVALSRCQFLIHGFSAVSESSHYLNPRLHNMSVDLEDPEHMSPSSFGDLVKREIGAYVKN